MSYPCDRCGKAYDHPNHNILRGHQYINKALHKEAAERKAANNND